MSLAGSPALPDSSSPADMTIGLMPNFLNARLHCEARGARRSTSRNATLLHPSMLQQFALPTMVVRHRAA